MYPMGRSNFLRITMTIRKISPRGTANNFKHLMPHQLSRIHNWYVHIHTIVSAGASSEFQSGQRYIRVLHDCARLIFSKSRALFVFKAGTAPFETTNHVHQAIARTIDPKHISREQVGEVMCSPINSKRSVPAKWSAIKLEASDTGMFICLLMNLPPGWGTNDARLCKTPQ